MVWWIERFALETEFEGSTPGRCKVYISVGFFLVLLLCFLNYGSIQ